MADSEVPHPVNSLHQRISNALVGYLVDLLLGLQEFLLQQVGYFGDKVLLTVGLILVEHLLQGQKFIVADERSQLDFQILRVQERILLVIVSNCH